MWPSPSPQTMTSHSERPFRPRTKAGKNPPALGTPGAEVDYGIGGLPTDPVVSPARAHMVKASGGARSAGTDSLPRAYDDAPMLWSPP